MDELREAIYDRAAAKTGNFSGIRALVIRDGRRVLPLLWVVMLLLCCSLLGAMPAFATKV